MTLRSIGLGCLLFAVLAAPAQPQVRPELRPPGVTDSAIAWGKALFHGSANCAAYHGQSGRGNDYGPALTGALWLHGPGTYESLIEQVKHGVPASRSATGEASRLSHHRPLVSGYPAVELREGDGTRAACASRWRKTTGRGQDLSSRVSGRKNSTSSEPVTARKRSGQPSSGSRFAACAGTCHPVVSRMHCWIGERVAATADLGEVVAPPAWRECSTSHYQRKVRKVVQQDYSFSHPGDLHPKAHRKAPTNVQWPPLVRYRSLKSRRLLGRRW
jgi:hypothetical protein